MTKYGFGISPYEWDNVLLQEFKSKDLVPDDTEKVSDLEANFFDFAGEKPSSDVAQMASITFKFLEKASLNQITSDPKRHWQKFRRRINGNGLNASFQREFEPVVQNLYFSILTSKEVEKAIQTEPRLEKYKLTTVQELKKLIDKNHYGYRDTVDGILKDNV